MVNRLDAFTETVMSVGLRSWPNRPGAVIEAIRPEIRSALADLTSDDALKYRVGWPPPAGRRGRFNLRGDSRA